MSEASEAWDAPAEEPWKSFSLAIGYLLDERSKLDNYLRDKEPWRYEE